MKKLLVLASILGLTACNSTGVVKPVIQDRPDLVLPTVRPVEQKPIEWTVITKKNLQKKLAQLEKDGGNYTLIATTPEGYKNLSFNAAELRRFIEEQGAQIDAMRQYYEAPVTETK